ncbi:hypothetical protein [Streptomyces sp. NPDC059874]|uniref:hypothetical protein n=1 Tax=Streptomyces sp. NPDC059874 TaxID=3346983 RepID=UPI00365BC9F2
MRAYHKRTQQPFCLYLTLDETAQLLEELECLNLPQYEMLERVHVALNRVFTAHEERM